MKTVTEKCKEIMIELYDLLNSNEHEKLKERLIEILNKKDITIAEIKSILIMIEGQKIASLSYIVESLKRKYKEYKEKLFSICTDNHCSLSSYKGEKILLCRENGCQFKKNENSK